MELKEMVDHFKHEREAIAAGTPLGLLPPHLLCFRGEDAVCSVMAPQSTAWAISALMAAIPITKPSRVFMAVEALIGAAHDPSSGRALCVLQSDVDGSPVESETHPYSVADDGSLEWKPELDPLPVVGMLSDAIYEMFGFNVKNSAQDLMMWFQINGFAARIAPVILLGTDDGAQS